MDIRRHLIGGLLAGAVIAPAMVQADAPAPKWYDKLTLGGYVATDYEFWINQPNAYPNSNTDAEYNNSNRGDGSTVPGRVFDGDANVLDYTGELTLAYADSGSGTSANIDLLFGSLARVINGININEYNNNVPSVTSGNDLAIGQAYVSQAFGPLTLDLGRFATPVGYESWNVTANANFSRSLTYSLEPFFQTGAKLDYAGPAGFTASLWFDDGNSQDPENDGVYDAGKGYGVALGYTGIKNLALNAEFYSNQGGLFTGAGEGTYDSGYTWFDTNDMIDVNVAYTLNDSLSFAAEYFYSTMLDGVPSAVDNTKYSPKVNAFALYTTYNTPVKNLSVSGRFEQVDSPDAYEGGTSWGNNVGLQDLTVDSYTATIKYLMGPVTDILEYRADAANGYDFKTTTYGTKSQVDQTVTVAATYGF